MNFGYWRIAIWTVCGAGTAFCLGASASPLLAQTVAGEAVTLPPVIVEGATLAKPKVAPKKNKHVTTVNAPAAVVMPAKKLKKTSASSTGSDDGGVASNSISSSSDGEISYDIDGEGADANQSYDAVEGGISALQIGTAVSVVTGDSIKASQARTAVDVLRSMPGVSVNQQGGTGSVAVVRMRGAESNHTLVLIDGVEVNSTVSGLYDFSTLATDDIAQIEVLRGPQSGLYGSGALGGVINIITNSGKGPARVSVEGEAGSFNSRGGRASVSGGTDTAWGSFMVSSRQTDGTDISPIGHERDGSSLKTLSFKGGVRPFENLTLRGSFRANQLYSEYDDFSYSLPGYQMAVDAPNVTDTESWSGRLEGELSLFDQAWVQTVYATRANRDLDDVSFPSWLNGPSQSRLNDQATTYGYKSTVRIGPKSGGPVRHFVTGLIEHREETFDQPTAANFHAARDRMSYVGEVRGEYFGLLDLGATIRRDDNETFDDTTDWRVDGSLKLPATPFRLHASYGTGTKLPSFAELYGTFSRYTPNPDLKPERSKGWDVGVETTLLKGRAVVDVTYFKTSLTDEITEDYSGFPLITSVNMDGKSRRQGVEVAGRFQVSGGLSVGAAYTWLDARDDQDEREMRRPEHQARFDVDWKSLDGRARLNLSAIYNGEMPDAGFFVYAFDPVWGPLSRQETVTLDDYWLVRIAGSYELKPGLELFGRVENLLDQDYQEVFGYDTAGVAAYAGVRLKLEQPMLP